MQARIAQSGYERSKTFLERWPLLRNGSALQLFLIHRQRDVNRGNQLPGCAEHGLFDQVIHEIDWPVHLHVSRCQSRVRDELFRMRGVKQQECVFANHRLSTQRPQAIEMLQLEIDVVEQLVVMTTD
jgi:hypothetical protein